MSFSKQNMIYLIYLDSCSNRQLLVGQLRQDNIDFLVEHNLDVDSYYYSLNKDNIKLMHSLGIKINCYVVNEPENAEKLISQGT